MKKCLIFFITFFIIGVWCTGLAGAASYTYVMGNSSYIDVSATADPALVMEYTINPGLSGLTFGLNVGESNTFSFAQIGTSESWINEDDLTPKTIIAYVDFDNPDITQSLNGTSVGFAGELLFNQGWTITWDGPVTVNFGTGGQFVIALSDASYESGWWTGPDGFDCIAATVTHLADPTTNGVPEPATLLLLGLGLIGVFGIRKKIHS
ncbi:MAG: PEP-CTERM sorting domain-containing protein [Deltaproteobacteria bacterium]|nr:PEP-CTERM sorting domain-containing protein [Deltaproteobacteria bacterium]